MSSLASDVSRNILVSQGTKWRNHRYAAGACVLEKVVDGGRQRVRPVWEGYNAAHRVCDTSRCQLERGVTRILPRLVCSRKGLFTVSLQFRLPTPPIDASIYPANVHLMTFCEEPPPCVDGSSFKAQLIQAP